jgi:hypothetical protein
MVLHHLPGNIEMLKEKDIVPVDFRMGLNYVPADIGIATEITTVDLRMALDNVPGYIGIHTEIVVAPIQLRVSLNYLPGDVGIHCQRVQIPVSSGEEAKQDSQMVDSLGVREKVLLGPKESRAAGQSILLQLNPRELIQNQVLDLGREHCLSR